MVEIKENKLYLDSEDHRILKGIQGAFGHDINYMADLMAVGEKFGHIEFAKPGKEFKLEVAKLTKLDSFEITGFRACTDTSNGGDYGDIN